jgi:hypothetical protein
MSEGMPLAVDWALLRDFAVRSAGFPVGGLEVFGPGDESARLRAIAGEELLREAMTWQNPAAVDNALRKVATGSPTRPSRARQREEIVASYWQRYCAKCDTIGFFGPLAWGRFEDDAPPLEVRSGALVRERAVHLEAWGVQALAQALDPQLHVAAGPRSEDELRAALVAHPDAGVRDRGLEAIAHLEQARDRLATAAPGDLREALDALDATFTELTGRDPRRNPGMAYGARTLAYVDCLRDLDVSVGPGLVAELAPGLHTLFEAGRWYTGEVRALGAAIVQDALGDGRRPFPELLRHVLPALMGPRPDIDEVLGELHRRLAKVLADGDAAGAGLRAAAVFVDHRPSWQLGVHSSVDLQLAAADAGAVARGDYLAVVGDVHPGGNPLIQGVFAHRHPDPETFHHEIAQRAGTMAVLMPPWVPGLGVEARGIAVTPVDMVHIATNPDARAQAPRRTWLADDLFVEAGHVVDRTGALRVAVLDVLALPIFVSGVRVFDLLPFEEHTPRVAIGRMVLQRESWSVPAAEIPAHATDVAAFARDRGMPRRVFVKSPAERKPVYLDVESVILGRVACRQARQAAERDPDARLRFTEMLPGPDECWLRDGDGAAFVSEFRLVAVDRTRELPPGSGRQ